MSTALRYAVRSDQGRVRGDNQDSAYAGPRLLAVADGIGGAVGGAVASRIVIETIEPLDDDTPPADLLGALREATDLANVRLADTVRDEPRLDGMGTTLTAILFAGSRLGLCHVGDSRGYLLRDGRFEQITQDHTFVQSLVNEGRITQEEAATHPQRSLILKALTGHEVEPDLTIRETALGDRYLLCSDGLSDYVAPDLIDDAIRRPDPHDAADQMIELALQAGAPDNVTCVIADVVEPRHATTEPALVGAAALAAQPDAEVTDVHPVDGHADVSGAAEPVASTGTRFRRRRVLIPALVVVVALAALGGFYAWSQHQYFVGRDGKQVAVFKGLNVSVAGVHLYHRAWTTNLAVADLASLARQRVSSGLGADGRSDARRIVSNLSRNELLPLCPTLAPTPTATPRPSNAPKPRAVPTRPVRTATVRRAVPTKPKPTTATPPKPTPTPSPTPTPVRGKDCR